MSRKPIIEALEKSYLKKSVTLFKIGDTLRVQMRIIEGEKERTQAFMGVVISKRGTGLSETFTLYRHAYGSSMERVFMLHSPRISQMEVVRSGKVRRSKLYYLRGQSGKAMKIREQFVSLEPKTAETPSSESSESAST